nr:fimbrin-1-like [Tanacetum cinerariifolium]
MGVRVKAIVVFVLVEMVGGLMKYKFDETFIWQLMRYNMLQLLKHLRTRSHEITSGYTLKWANRKVKNTCKTSGMENHKDKSLSNGIFFLELPTAMEPRVVNWNLVTKGEPEDDAYADSQHYVLLLSTMWRRA